MPLEEVEQILSEQLDKLAATDRVAERVASRVLSGEIDRQAAVDVELGAWVETNGGKAVDAAYFEVLRRLQARTAEAARRESRSPLSRLASAIRSAP